MENLKTFKEMLDKEVIYRCDAFNGVDYDRRINPYDVIQNEIFETGNTDIFSTVNELYCDSSDENLDDLENAIDMGEYDDDYIATGDEEEPKRWSVKKVTDYILKTVQKATGVNVKYFLWLANLDAIKSDYYDKTSGRPILKFDTTKAVVISNLGDSILYGFLEFPEPVEKYKTPDEIKE